MRAAIVTGPYKVEIREIPDPQIEKDTEIKIKVVSGAICNVTDNMLYATETPETHWPFYKFPFKIGHECSGYLVDKGTAVKDLDIGDRIVYWSVENGAFADYLIIDTAQWAAGKINESVPDDIASIMEMVIGCSRFYYTDSGEKVISKGNKVAIFGLGPAGLIFALTSRLMGASKVVGLDVLDSRMQKALDMGVDYVFNAKDPQWLEKVTGALDGKPDIIIDATGKDIIGSIKKLGKPGARLLPFGIPPFNWNDRVKEITDVSIIPNFCGVPEARHAMKDCTEWANNGLLLFEPIITHHLPLEELKSGFDLCREHPESTLKVIIEINSRFSVK